MKKNFKNITTQMGLVVIFGIIYGQTLRLTQTIGKQSILECVLRKTLLNLEVWVISNTTMAHFTRDSQRMESLKAKEDLRKQPKKIIITYIFF